MALRLDEYDADIPVVQINPNQRCIGAPRRVRTSGLGFGVKCLGIRALGSGVRIEQDAFVGLVLGSTLFVSTLAQMHIQIRKGSYKQTVLCVRLVAWNLIPCQAPSENPQNPTRANPEGKACLEGLRYLQLP